MRIIQLSLNTDKTYTAFLTFSYR